MTNSINAIKYNVSDKLGGILSRNKLKKHTKIVATLMTTDDVYKSMKNTDLKPAKGRVAIYARVANNQDGDLTKQIITLENEIKRVGDMSYSLYSEVASGISHSKNERSKLYRLIYDVKLGLIKRVYIKSRDRFARDFSLEREIANELNKCGVEIIELL